MAGLVATTSTTAALGGRASLWAYLRGAWRLTRTMKHAEDGHTMGVVDAATATWTPVKDMPDTLLYREEGQVAFASMGGSGGVANAKRLPFYREYMYTFTSPTTADVAFYRPGNEEEHLKFFHTLSIESASGEGSTTEHLCIDDLYVASIRIGSATGFQAEWQVKGPKKNYRIFTTYTRCTSEEEGRDGAGSTAEGAGIKNA